MMVTGVNRKRYFIKWPSWKSWLIWLPTVLIIVPYMVAGIKAPESTFYAMGELLQVLAIAFTEELGFHGLIYARLRESFSKRASSIITILLFAVCHCIMAFTGLDSSYVWSTFVLVVVFSFAGMVLTLQTESLVPLVALRYIYGLISRNSMYTGNAYMICDFINIGFLLIYGIVFLVLYIKKKKDISDPCAAFAANTVTEYKQFEAPEEESITSEKKTEEEEN